MRLRELYDRVESCGNNTGISGNSDIQERTVELSFDLVTRAFRGIYPFQSDATPIVAEFGKDKQFSSAEEVIEIVAPRVDELEKKLQIAQAEINIHQSNSA